MSDVPYAFLLPEHQVVSRDRPFSIDRTIHRTGIYDYKEAKKLADELFATGKYVRVSVEIVGGRTKYEAGKPDFWQGRPQSVTSIVGLSEPGRPRRYKRK